MPWLKLDDNFMSHPKVLRLSGIAIALWLEALCYAGRHLTDGRIAPHVLAQFRFRRAAPELRHAGLWEPDPDGGDRIHDYHAYNPPASDVRAKRAATADRVRAYRARTASGCNAPVTSYDRVPVTHMYASPVLYPSLVQDQEHPATAGHLPVEPVENSKRAKRAKPNPKQLAKLALALVEADPALEGVELKETLKQRAAQLGLAYDAEAVRVALDGVEFFVAKQAG